MAKNRGPENLGHKEGLVNPGPFKWFPSPTDPELRYHEIYVHFRSQGRIIDRWNLPGGQGRVVVASERDGVLILLMEHGGVFFEETHDVVQGNISLHERYVSQPYDLYIDGVITMEEYDEIKREQGLIKENLLALEVAEKHDRAVWALRLRAMYPATMEYVAARRLLDLPGLTKTQINSATRDLRKARLTVKHYEDLSEGELFDHVRGVCTAELEVLLYEALGREVPKQCVLPNGIALRFKGVPEPPTQEELDAQVGGMYRLLERIRQCSTPEELYELDL